MAALSGHDKMAAEAMGEYMQVVVATTTAAGDTDPGQQQVVVLQGGAAEDISPELLQSIAHSDTVYYVQPDGSLVAGGTLAEVTAARQHVPEEPQQQEEEEAAPGLMDAALQLKTVADHVALRQGSPGPATRILQQKDLKSICVQVPGLQSKETPAPGVVNIRENVSVPVNVSVGSGAQVVQIKVPPPPTQQYVVKAVQPPVQVLIQQPRAQPAKLKPLDSNANERAESPDEHGCCVAHHHDRRKPSGADKGHKDGQKRKKAIKIKTRSGRISRPPKHKAKDYKFLKVGDSIQDSSGDSSDYSELSSEEEADGGKEVAVGKRQTPYNVANSLFQCQKCEKSYMGKGGLFRHYRLYPAHGQLDPSFILEARKNGDAGGTSEPKKPIPRPRKRLLEDPQNPQNPNVSVQPTLASDGLEIVPASLRGRRYIPGRRFGRPKKIMRNGTVEEPAVSVKELIQQCEEKDLKEHVAPSVAKLLSVYDFLLLKVKQEQSDKPLFPRVYWEFEKLHARVKALAEEYVINMDQNTEKPLEVADSRVAESLGISQDMTVRMKPVPSVTVVEQEKPIKENGDEPSNVELMPPSKRLKMDEDRTNDLGDVTNDIAPVTSDAVQSSGEEQHCDSPLIPPQAAVLDTDVTNEAIEQETIAAEHEVMVEVMETLQPQDDPEAGDAILEAPPSPHSSDASQSHDHPLNLSCHPTEEAQSFQTYITHSDTQETVVAETDLPLSDEAQTAESVSQEPVNPALLCEANLSSVSIDCSQNSDPTRTFVSTSLPTALVEAACRDSSQISFMEVGGALIPSTTAFTTGGLNVVENATAFSLNHGHEYVFIHSAEGAATEEAVVIFDSTEAAESHLDTVVALVEM